MLLVTDMATTLRFILKQLGIGLPPEDDLIINKEIRETNLTRCMVLSGICAPYALLCSCYFFGMPYLPNSMHPIWHNYLFILHLFMLFMFSWIFTYTLRLKNKKATTANSLRFLPNAAFLLLGLWGAIAAVYSQMLSSSIIPYFIVCMLISVMLLIRPIQALLMLSIIYYCFFLGISSIATDHQELSANLLNGLCLTIAAFGVTVIFWNNNMSKHRQQREVRRQQEELIHQYEELVQATKTLEKTNASKDRFFSILAHDLRGPITSTLALTELLEEGAFEEDIEERQNMYKLLQNSLDSSSKLLENVLLWSRNQEGVLNFRPAQLSVRQTAQFSINLLAAVAANKRIIIENLIDDQLSVYADADMINTVFRNLISNAIKFSHADGRVEVRGKAKVNEKGELFAVIEVIDFGVGMNQRTLNEIFSVEHKSILPGTNNEMGTGLGLVLCKDFVEKHKGTILVDSIENEGSKFIITLPGHD